jgi:ribosomal protein L28
MLTTLEKTLTGKFKKNMTGKKSLNKPNVSTREYWASTRRVFGLNLSDKAVLSCKKNYIHLLLEAIVG